MGRLLGTCASPLGAAGDRAYDDIAEVTAGGITAGANAVGSSGGCLESVGRAVYGSAVESADEVREENDKIGGG
jgi:hypothetical protein